MIVRPGGKTCLLYTSEEKKRYEEEKKRREKEKKRHEEEMQELIAAQAVSLEKALKRIEELERKSGSEPAE